MREKSCPAEDRVEGSARVLGVIVNADFLQAD